MTKSFAILLMVTMLLVDGACWLHHIRADHEAALFDEIAAQAELNRMDLQILGKNLDNLNRETRFVLAELPIFYEHFHICATWEVKTTNQR
ncbi:MAG: hypothetical protein PVG85_03875 [Deltaproteobacteria bacterium]